MCDTNHHVMCISDTGYMILRIIEDHETNQKKKTGKFMQDSSYLPAFSIIAPSIGPKSPWSAIMSVQEYS